jgi:mannitol operon repressor
MHESGSDQPHPILESHPHLKEFIDFLPELNKETERGAVLVGCSFLDQFLRRVLLAYFIEGAQSSDLVDGFNAPLGTFSARIRAVAALGLLMPHEVEDCHLMRRIRNRFSHEVHVSFQDQQIVDWCASLHASAKDYPGVTINARQEFTTAVASLILNLTNRPHYAGLERRRSRSWPI